MPPPKVNPVKLRQDADKLEKAGKLDQAIAVYKQVVEDNPRDWNTINKVGDLFAKLNKNREASEEYAKVADFYAKDGFLLKAIAIWKKINKLDASALDPYLNLADLYAKQGLMMEAKGQYQIVVDEYIKRGKVREAGDVLKKMADIDPGDLKIRSRLADLYTREGNSAKAVEEHIAIADELNKKGHLAEALQVLEKGLKIDAKSNRLRIELARVHLVQRNFDKAIHYLEDAVRQAPADTQILARLGEAYLGGKKIEEAEAIFKRLLEIDPKDEESRIQMGRVYVLQGQFDRAFDDLVPVVERLLERREGDKAASLLLQLVQKNPGHIKSLVKLVEIYRLLQKESSVVLTYSQLTEAYVNLGQLDQAASVLEILIQREPQNQQHKTKLQFVRAKQQAAHARPTTSAPPVPSVTAAQAEPGDIDVDFGETPSEQQPAFFGADETPAAVTPIAPAAPATPTRPPRIEISGPLTEEDREFIEEHLAEGKVFRKYGLVDKAADQFESVIARFPDNMEARQELRDIYKDKGLVAKATEQSLALAEICRQRGDEAAAQLHQADAGRSAPSASPPAAAPAASAQPSARADEEFVVTGEDEVTTPEDAASVRNEEEDVDIAVDVEDEASGGFAPGDDGFADRADAGFNLDTETPAEPVDQGPLVVDSDELGGFDLGAPEIPMSQESVLAPDEMDLDLGAVDGFAEEPPAPPPTPAPSTLARPARGTAQPTPQKRVVPPAVLTPPQARRVPPPVVAPPVAVAAPGLPAEIQRTLDEVDSYMSLGFVDDARDAVRELLARYPGHPAIVEKIADLGLELETEAEAPADAGMADLEALAGEAPIVPAARFEEPASPFDQGAVSEDPFADLELGAPAAPEVRLADPARRAAIPSNEDDLGFGEPSAAINTSFEAEFGLDSAPVTESASPFDPASIDEELGFGSEPAAPEDQLGLSIPEPEPVVPEMDLSELAEPSAPDTSQGPATDDLDLGEPEPAAVADAALFEPPPEPESQDPFAGASFGAPVAASDDIGMELDGLFGAQTADPTIESAPESATSLGDSGLAEIFKEFKKGVDKQLGKEDYDTRYNLGIAYKEMGLVDEAIAEFQLAAKDPARTLECSSMLGICFLEKGLPKLAVKWFEKGLKAPGRSDEEYQGLRYDLATAHEAAGETDKALNLFTDLYGQDANFRDVAQKVRELSANG